MRELSNCDSYSNGSSSSSSSIIISSNSSSISSRDNRINIKFVQFLIVERNKKSK